MIQFPKRFATNGSITRFILKIAKKGENPPEEVKVAAIRAMRAFPLSSYKMVYDRDLDSLTPEMKRVILEAAVETDNEKFQSLNRFEASLGLKPNLKEPFGRSNI